MWAVVWKYRDNSAFGVWCVCETEKEAEVLAGLLDMDCTDKAFWKEPVIVMSARGTRGAARPAAGGSMFPAGDFDGS